MVATGQIDSIKLGESKRSKSKWKYDVFTVKEESSSLQSLEMQH